MSFCYMFLAEYKGAKVLPGFQIVTLDNYYRSIQDEELGPWFSAMLRMRVRGWAPEYPRDYLPIDSLDYIGRHHLFCVQHGGHLVPIAGFRSVLLDQCDFFHLTEPHLGFAGHAGAFEHVKALSEIFDGQRALGNSVISGSKVTIDKAYRGDKDLSELVKELIGALLYSDSLSLKKPVHIGSGVFRFKTHLFLRKLGFQPLFWDGQELGPIGVPEAGNEPIQIMRLETFSEWVKQSFEKHAFLLHSRKVIGSGSKNDSDREAA